MEPWAIQILISAGTGGLFGAILTAIVNHHRRQVDFALQLTDRLIENIPDHRVAVSALRSAAGARLSVGMADKVVDQANRLEMFAYCFLRGHSDQSVLKSLRLPEMATEFYELLSSSQTFTFRQGGGRSMLDDLPYLRELAHYER